ncbi:methyl-accepting chemotaxis protein [Deltaproteobacteria bacterium OttesenSCG-928-K17]|nr:methyl-accepting chemotaxis protein [Deltaproteobacteria bacterium OttesenSCG-928-K17]
MKLSTKIIAGFISTCLIFLLLSLIIIFLIRPIHSGTRKMEDNYLPLLDKVTAVRTNVSLLSSLHTAFGLSGEEPILEKANEAGKGLDADLKELQGIIDASSDLNDSEVEESLKGVRDNYVLYGRLVGNLPTLMADTLDSLEEMSAAYENFREKAQAFFDHQADGLSRGYHNGLTTSAFLARMESLKSGQEILELMNVAFVQAEGAYLNDDLEAFETVNESLAKAKDETSRLLGIAGGADIRGRDEAMAEVLTAALAEIETFEKLLPTYAEAIKVKLEQDEKKEVIVQAMLNGTGELKAVALARTLECINASESAINKVVNTLFVGLALALIVSLILAVALTRGITRPITHMIETLNQGVEEVERTAEELSVSSDSLARGAADNADNLGNTSEALRQLGSMTHSNSENSSQANTLVAEALNAAGKADESMNGVIGAMAAISASGVEIGRIIKTIDEIAFQTNLLALNAAVEAARAGEAGAGFAVVADEVRNLAGRSAEAARNTAELIEETVNNIGSGEKLVAATADNFKLVSDRAGQVAGIMSQIAQSSEQQDLGLKQISAAIGGMDKVTQTNAQAAGESAEAARSLTGRAEQLLGAVYDLTAMVYGRGNSSPKAGRRPALPVPKNGGLKKIGQ